MSDLLIGDLVFSRIISISYEGPKAGGKSPTAIDNLLRAKWTNAGLRMNSRPRWRRFVCAMLSGEPRQTIQE
jgi:hypothetical protein